MVMITERMRNLAGIQEDACTKNFGDILFGDFFGKDEADTPHEKKTFKDLVVWLDGFEHSTQMKILKSFQELKKCSDHWPDILEPDKTKLYRGIGFSWKEAYDYGIDQNKTIQYKPKGLLQSWTTDMVIAKDFALRWSSFDPFSVILSATFPKSELLFNSGFLNKVGKSQINIKPEDEIIRINNKPVKVKIEKVKKNDTLKMYALETFRKVKEALKRGKDVFASPELPNVDRVQIVDAKLEPDGPVFFTKNNRHNFKISYKKISLEIK